MKTVAIIGSHPATRELFDWERDDCDVWVFNEACKEDWVKRADAVFQVHQPTIWRSSTNRNDSNHYDWLKSGDTPTIYMIDEFEDVPNAVRYPLEDAIALVPGFAYFTSSVSYAIPLAILKGYKRIELYGVEMETQTEYGHQREGVRFWIGYALGRGIEVIHHSPKFWKAPLYGYEGNARIEIEHYQKRIEMLSENKDKAVENHKRVVNDINILLKSFVRDYKTDLSQLDKLVLTAGQMAHNFGMVDGAIQVCEKYRDKCQQMLEEVDDYMIVRQEYEGQLRAGMKAKDDEYNKVHVHADRLHKARLALNTNANQEKREKLVGEFIKHFDEYIKHTTMTGVNNGVFMENRDLLMQYDQLLASNGEPVEMEAASEIMPAGL